MPKLKRVLPPLGKEFGKSDLDRIGYFHEPRVTPFDKYKGVPVKFREGIEKGRQMIPGPPLKLFEEKFMRIFEGEALYDPFRKVPKKQLVPVKGVIWPSAPAKKHSTPGDYYGCFEKISYFSPALIKPKKARPELPNVRIKPNPKGGPGYANICLSPFPAHAHEPYDPPEKKPKVKEMYRVFQTTHAPMDYFPPNPYKALHIGSTYVRPREVKPKILGPNRLIVPFPKKPGGSHAGCFDKFPIHYADPYDRVEPKKPKIPKPTRIFISGGPPLRSKFTSSIINKITNVSCNLNNYVTYTPRVYPLEK
ncbi:UPF0602 protein C4orf47 homolog [Apis dorsata]|uniref:UPF0602 protein C4orf47 homolog n=1 Tax=Apis dorsata TaxID=7462 RepID=UPI001293B895|nr:UPF0602 protein C4orf47 homolog [Apis dorsata]